jgi:hypothetical protein
LTVIVFDNHKREYKEEEEEEEKEEEETSLCERLKK